MDASLTTEKSWFAPAGRASGETLQQEAAKIARSELIATLLDAMPDLLMVLNEYRQIVGANKRLLDTCKVDNPEALLGLRPGEAVGCVRSHDGPDGCGASRHCAVCGTVLAVLASQESGLPQRGECQLIIEKDGYTALDLDVYVTPVVIEGEKFTVVALRDISSEKRRYVIERVFFHDILNNASGIRGLASLLQEGVSPVAEDEYKNWLVNLADNLIEEINHQRRLLDAEQGAYQPVFEPVELPELLRDICCLYENHERVPGRILKLEELEACTLVTDRPLLRRIVGNMVLNALEASSRGAVVTVGAVCSDGQVTISVTNPGEIPQDVQLQLFKRSFSTKEKQGRGLGTYSMKLFGERYLGGEVGFRSEGGLTTFFVQLPLLPVVKT